MVLLGTGVKNVPPKAWGQRNDVTSNGCQVPKLLLPLRVLSDQLAPEQFTESSGCPQWEKDFAFNYMNYYLNPYNHKNFTYQAVSSINIPSLSNCINNSPPVKKRKRHQKQSNLFFPTIHSNERVCAFLLAIIKRHQPFKNKKQILNITGLKLSPQYSIFSSVLSLM